MTTQDTRRRETAQRGTGRVRVGSSALREGQPDRMETTTRDRDALRVPVPRPAPRADPGPAGPRRARASQRGAGQARPTPSRLQPPRPVAPAAIQEPPSPSSRLGRLASAPAKVASSGPATKPLRTGSPLRPSSPLRTSSAPRSVRATAPRLRFAVLVLLLLGGGLICLLVINTTLGATSFRISQLQSKNATLATQEQALQQQLAADRSPARIAERAYQLGMRVQRTGIILDLRTHRFDRLATQPGVGVQLGAAGGTAAAGTATGKPPAAKTQAGPARTANRGSASQPGGTGP